MCLGDRLLAYMLDAGIERASVTFWRVRLYAKPDCVVPPMVFTNGHTLEVALRKRWPDVEGYRERMPQFLRAEYTRVSDEPSKKWNEIGIERDRYECEIDKG